MFHVSCICIWAELDFYSFQYARIIRVNYRGEWMLDAGQAGRGDGHQF